MGSKQGINFTRICVCISVVFFLMSTLQPISADTTNKKKSVNDKIKAQNTIKGNVKDAKGISLPGVSVVIEGTTQGVQTDFEGNFEIVATFGDVLLFSYIGMTSQRIKILPNELIQVVMVEDTQALDQVIVVAYGTSTKEDFTGSAVQISEEQMQTRALTNPLTVLEGAASGVQFSPSNGQPGSGPNIQIRGIGSVNANREPLYIVDGTVFTGDFASINAADIASISVLKDAASTALYGNKAANGVVIITTKKGHSRNGDGVFTFDISQGLTSRSIPEYDRVDAEQYYPLMWEAYRNSLVTSGVPISDASQLASGLLPRNDDGNQIYNGADYEDISQILGYNPFNVPDNRIVGENGALNPSANLLYPDDLDWEKPLTRAGLRTNSYFSYAGASEKTDYFLSLGHLREEGYIINSDFERLTARINLNTKVKDWGKVGLNISGATSNSNLAVDGSGTAFVNPFFSTRIIGPIYPVYQHDPITGEFVLDTEGNRVFDSGDLDRNRASGAIPGRHVIQETLLNIDRDKINTIAARTFGEMYFLKNFTFTFNASLDKRFLNNEGFDSPIIGDGAPDGRARRDASVRTALNYNQLVKYKNTFDKHSIETLLGHESFNFEFTSLSGLKQVQGVDGNSELVNFTTTVQLESFRRNYTTEGYLSRFNYDFDKRYYLSASYRRDASSRFSKEERWGDFFSVGGAWRLDQEQFLEYVDWINTLKLRASYGEVGNDSNLDRNPVSFFANQGLFSLNRSNAAEPGIQSSTLSNPGLTWEKNRQTDVAIEFGFLQNRISGSVEYYNKVSDDLLFEVPKSVQSGLDGRIENTGSLVNKGFEIDVSLDIIRTNNFNWNFGFNAATIENEFKELPQKEIVVGPRKLVVGRSIFDFWLRDWYGVDPANGDGLYVANDELDPNTETDVRIVNGTKVTTNQNKAKNDFVGSAIPDVYGSFRNTFSYKGITVSALFAYQLGGQTFDTNYAGILSSGSYGEALSADILNRWQKPGDITDIPRLDNTQIDRLAADSDRWLVDSDFLSIRQLNVSYELPERMVGSLGLRNARIYMNGENLWVFTKRKGLDVNQNFSGTTTNRFTPARVITLGINVAF